MVAPWRFLPCSSCCGCVIFADDFNRAGIGSDWEQKSGIWSIDANRLKGCGSSSKILWTGEETLTDHFNIKVRVNYQVAGQIARIFFGNDDLSGPYAEWELLNFGSPTTFGVRLFDAAGEQVGPTKTLRIYYVDPTHPMEIGLCLWSDGDDYRMTSTRLRVPGISGQVEGLFGAKIDVGTFLGVRCGLGGDDAGTCLLYDEFHIERPNLPCDTCYIPCPALKWSEASSCLKLTFEGFGNGPCLLWGSWEGCHCLNRTIYLAQAGCNWKNSLVWADYCFNATTLYTGGMAYWEADVRFADGHYWLYVTLYAGYHGDRTTLWRADLGENKPEAMTLDVTDFELVTDLVSDICDLTNVTLHAVAVDGHDCPPQQDRCLACGSQCGEYPSEIRLRTSGFGGANDGDFVLGPGSVDWYHDECDWSYNGTVTWIVRFIYDNQSPSINIFVDHGGYWDGIYGSQTWPIDCSNFTITLTSGSKTAIISNV